MMGGRFVLWLPPRFGIEGSFTSTRSGLNATHTENGTAFLTADTAARVINVSTRLLVRLTRSEARTSVHLGLGASLVRSGGAAYQNLGSATHVAGLWGVGFAFKLVPRVALQFDAEDRVYHALFAGFGDRTETRLQNDLVMSLGLSVRLGRP
jgi:hypothetical protein